MGGLSEYEIILSRCVLDKALGVQTGNHFSAQVNAERTELQNPVDFSVCVCLLLSREVLILLYTTEQTQQPQCRFYDIQLEAGS